LIGKSGRRVRCANCQKDWQAYLEPGDGGQANSRDVQEHDETSKNIDEDALDAAFEAVEKENWPAKSSGAKFNKGAKDKNRLKPGEAARQRADMEWRKNTINRSMPRARMRRVVRIAGAVVLTLVIVFIVVFRVSIIRAFPELADVYQAVGLGVNIVGLEFSEVKTLRSLENGVETLKISAGISSVSSKPMDMPRVVISLLDDNGVSIFDWSVTPRASMIVPGEWIELNTQLSAPPEEARSIRLAFENAS